MVKTVSFGRFGHICGRKTCVWVLTETLPAPIGLRYMWTLQHKTIGEVEHPLITSDDAIGYQKRWRL